jgi:MFS transporter, OFA family, oxalate/formate antiporter
MGDPERGNLPNAWLILVIATFALIISNGLAIGGLPPFYKPVREEFVLIGAIEPTRAETFIANSANITFLMSGIFSLLGGWLLTRIRIKLLMVIGCLLLGGGLIIHAQAASAEMVYLARFLMGASLGFVGVLLTGTSLGGFFIPLLAAPLIANYGWRNAMFAISFLVWLILLPAIIYFVRDRPAVSDSAAATVASTIGMTLGQALKTPVFWALGLCAALVFYPIFVTSQQFILYLQSAKIGVAPETAAFAQSALFGISLGGKFIAGALSDKFSAVRVMVFCALLMFLSSLVLLNLSASTALLFLLPFAIGYGGTFVLLQRLVADLFGRREVGKILGAAIGGRITGYLADQAGGDYTYAFYGVTIAAGLAFASTIGVKVLSRSYNMEHER